MPPLRERKEEIIPLAELFLSRARAQWVASAAGLSEEGCEALLAFRWPGNVRQLKNVVERAVTVCSGDVVELEDLPDEVWTERGEVSPLANREGGEIPPPDRHAACVEEPFRSLPVRMREFEIAIIRDALEQAQGNQAQAARMLGVPRRTLASKVQLHGLATQSTC